jgi:plastocyanin
MRARPIVLGATAALLTVATLGASTGNAAAARKRPVKLEGTVNVHGTEKVSAKADASLTVALDDFFLSPTFVKAKAGQRIEIEIENEGGATHTFTSDALGVDEQLSPGETTAVEITVPSSGSAFRVYCRFHEASGMQGAVFTKKGARPSSATSSSGGSGSSGSSGSPGSSGAGIPGY